VGLLASTATLPWAYALIGLALALSLAIATLGRGRLRGSDRYKRGARVLSGRQARRAVARRAASELALAGVPIAPAEETRHFKLIGTTGTGKSTAIAALLGAALRRGDRAVIADADGSYAARFYAPRRGDVLLNPFDARSVRWNPFAELQVVWDVEQLAASLIPLGEDSAGREWRGYGRTLLGALLRRCWERGDADARELWRLLTVAPAPELRELVAGTPAQPFLEAENARMFSSIRAVAVSAAAAFEHVQLPRARTFSVRGWVQGGAGALFMPYGATQIAALRSVIAAWLRLAIFEAMMRPGQERRLWLVVDELDALGPIEGLKDALARLRKFGGVCVLGFQSIAQVSATYGGAEAQTIVENCGNTLILRCAGSEHGGTSQFAARLIGEREVLRRQVARSRERAGPLSGTRRSHSVSQQQLIESAVLAAELEQLPDLTGYVKTAGAPQWLRVAFRAG
jgi:type IV secretory pathway TraG/TraD family ATPase VirD4